MTYEFAFTTDTDYIRKMLMQDHVLRANGIKHLVDPTIYFPVCNERVRYVSVSGYGLFMLILEGGECDVHLALTKDAYGLAVSICRQGMVWLREQIPGVTISAMVPKGNDKVKRLALQSGLTILDESDEACLMYSTIE